MDLLQVIGVLLAFGSILFLTVIFTKLFAGKTKKAMKGQYINVVETVSLGLDKQIHLIRVENQFVLVATAGKSVEFLTTLKLDDFEEDIPEASPGGFDFKALFEKYIQAYKDKKAVNIQSKSSKSSEMNLSKQPEKESINMAEGETFKSNLSRLKSITSVMYEKGGIDEDDGTNEK